MKKKLLLLGLLPVLGVGAASTKGVNAAAGKLDSFFSDIGNDRDKYCEKAMDLNSRIADEGVVLLKNANGFLPMAKDSKVSLAGKSSVSLVRGGAGSGAGSVSRGITEIKMVDSLKNAGLQVNKTLSDFYDSSASGNGRTNGNTNWKGISEVTIGETPLSSYSETILASMDTYNDAAIFVISREGSEGCDVKTCNAHDSQKDPKPISKRHALEMSINEEALFEELKKHTDNIIIVVNSGNAYECDVFEKDPAVKAILWMGTPGANGAGAVGRILTGDVNPSGKTVDTWTRDFTKDPSFQNFSDNAQNNLTTDAQGNEIYAPADTLFNADGTPVRSDGSYKGAPKYTDEKNKVVEYGLNGVRPSAFLNYEEGIYVDYRYYETVYADIAASDKAAADAWYDGEEGVVYPFGYGLSYTSFNQEIVSCDIKDMAIDAKNKDVRVNMEVKVTNTGNVAGKEAVQVYFKPPYIDGGIEKAYNNLCAIGKTGLIEPGASETVKVDFYLQDVASYDFNDANKDGFKGYELDAGNYGISINKSAHEEYESVSFTISEALKYEEDRYTGYKVENRFTDNGFYSSLPSENDFEFTQMSRQNFEQTFPTAPTIESRTLGANSRVEEFFTHRFTMADVEEENTWEYVPQDVYKTKEDIEALGWSQVAEGNTLSADKRTLKFADMVGVALDDPKWDQLLNEFTWEEMEQFVDGASHNPAVSQIGKPDTGDSDGPSKFKIMWWCGGPIVAATFNERLAKEQGDCVGMEAHIESTYGWAGPGVNIHRSPFGGRNFEYYSGDPFLTGRIAGRVIEGATDKGIYCFFKHFAVNDQEKHREGVACFLTEQALREIYLKPFQMCIQEGKSTGIMSSYNRLGLMETAASYPLLTEVLRNEWGFKGSIISDMTHHGNSAFDAGMYENINNRLLAGCNNQLDGDDYSNDMNCKWKQSANDGKGAPVYKNANNEDVESYSWWYAVRKCCKECLYMCANCGAMSTKFDVIDSGMKFGDSTDNRIVANVGDELDIEVIFGEHDYMTDVKIDPATPLPEGLSFDGQRIKGTVEKPCNVFIRVIFTDDMDAINGNTLNLTVLAVAQTNAGDIGKTKVDDEKKCSMSVVAASALVSMIALAGVGLLLLRRKEK